MGRVAKKAPAAAVKEVEDSPTVTQARTRRTPKPNPKYTNESIVVPPKLESDTPGSSDLEDKPADAKVAKSVKKEPAASAKKAPVKGKIVPKKQKLEYDDPEETEDADEKPDSEEKPPTRATRSGKGGEKDTLKVGEESVAIVDVSSIIGKMPATIDTPKNVRGGPRKRAVPEESPSEDQAKKKKEDEKLSMITARKSYIPSPTLAKKPEIKASPKEVKVEVKKEEPVEVKKEGIVVKSPVIAIRQTRRGAGTADSPLSEPAEKKVKVEDVKIEEVKQEPKKLPMLRKSEQTVTKVAPQLVKSPTVTLPSKIVNNNIRTIVTAAKPVPRILNSMVTPKGKQSPNVKLAGDGTDKKVFSIDLTDDSIKEKKIIATAISKSPLKTSVAVKENVAINKPNIVIQRPQPSMVLKNKLESELIRMKSAAATSAAFRNRQVIPVGRLSNSPAQNNAFGPRRITKFESWYVIDVKNLEQTPFRHTHTQSMIRMGNKLKDLTLPSTKWDYKVTLQRRQPRAENNNEEDVYNGDPNDNTNESDKSLMEPCSILFKRCHRENNKIMIDRSLMVKNGIYTITMNGKQCKLIGAPEDIKSMEDLETLVQIIDSSSLENSCVEFVTQNESLTIS